MLYLTGTPIGNIGDMSPRAKEVLSSVDLIACEDTRRTGLLLSQTGITNKLTAYHEHNKAAKGPQLIDKLLSGMDIALVSDAGMPCINDPGEDLVRECIDKGIEVTVIPGPVAAITALCMSGLPAVTFHYEGFLPSEGGARRKRLQALKAVDETILIYEAPHRLLKLIDELDEAGFTDCKAVFCRELTKKFEQVIRLTVGQAREYFTETPPKGEFVIVLQHLADAGQAASMSQEDIDGEILRLHGEGLSTKQIAAKIAEMSGIGKKEIYSRALNLLK